MAIRKNILNTFEYVILRYTIILYIKYAKIVCSFNTLLEGNLRYRVLSHTDHTRILRIIVDETQKERRLNWTFVDKFFCWNVFLKREVLMNEKMKDRWM